MLRYKSLRKADTYIYLAERDNFDSIPDALMTRMGELEFVLEFKLSSARKLAKEDPQKVLQSLDKQGFHLQLPEMPLPRNSK